MSTDFTHDVVIIGGGAAGLSAAVTLARSLRSAVVVDSGEPRNAPAEGVHNLLGREGISPLDLLEAGRKEAEHYGATIMANTAVAVQRSDARFTVSMADGALVTARRLLLATGLVDDLPDLPGVREYWGRSVLHCPYCHGWEVRGRRIGVLGTTAMGVHQALLFRQLSENVTLFRHRMPDPGSEAWEQLDALGIRVVDGEVSHLRGEDGAVKSVVLDDGGEHPVDAVAVAPRFMARADLFEQLGGTLTEHPMGRFIETDPTGQTSIPGVWAAGNSRDLGAVVAASAAAGLAAGGALNADLIAEDAAAAVARAKAA